MRIPEPRFENGQPVEVSPDLCGTVESQAWLIPATGTSPYWRCTVRMLDGTSEDQPEGNIDPVEPGKAYETGRDAGLASAVRGHFDSVVLDTIRQAERAARVPTASERAMGVLDELGVPTLDPGGVRILAIDERVRHLAGSYVGRPVDPTPDDPPAPDDSPEDDAPAPEIPDTAEPPDTDDSGGGSETFARQLYKGGEIRDNPHLSAETREAIDRGSTTIGADDVGESYEDRLLREREEAHAGEDHFKTQRDAALNCLRWLIGDLLPLGGPRSGHVEARWVPVDEETMVSVNVGDAIKEPGEAPEGERPPDDGDLSDAARELLAERIKERKMGTPGLIGLVERLGR